MPSFLLLFCFCLTSFCVLSSSQSLNSSLPLKGFQYKLPDGYAIGRSTGSGDLYPGETDPFSHFFFGITLKVTGADDTTPFYRQFATYTLNHALQTMTAEIKTPDNIFTSTNFTLQNKAGAVACRVIFEAQQQAIGGFSGGGISPRDGGRHALSLPALLEPRQASRPPKNESSALETLTPIYASDWYGPRSTPQDFFLALATMIIQIADQGERDTTINWRDVEKYGYHLNVTYVPIPGSQRYLTNRGVLNLCAYAYGELTERLGYGTQPVTNFETTLVWINATGPGTGTGIDFVEQHVLRYEGQEG
ncbi:MAG: hypothetical protein Q9221_003210 [Calogaya cf. arnoldii]